MDRKIPFVIGETYHAYTRGVEKRIICETTDDFDRLQLLLYLCNDSKAVHFRRLQTRYRGLPSVKIFEQEGRTGTLVDILAYALLPNHFHLLLREKIPNGISNFMHKLMTSYAMYFNIKYERSGPLFTRPFRSRYIDSDPYLLWAHAYILLNPLSLLQPDWKSGIRDMRAARKFLQQYQYGSFSDSMSIRPASRILALDDRLPTTGSFDDLLTVLADNPDRGESSAIDFC
jgi:putative transposase